MKFFQCILKAAVVAIVVAVATPAPALADDTTISVTKTKHHYVYYADHDIYFAPETKTYYWMADGNWTSGTALPVEDREYIKSGGVTIELDAERPYERHDYVVAHYKHKHDRDDDRH